jgi:hypothetical protein
MTTADITVAIPTIPPRAHWRQEALQSVWQQTHPPKAVAVAVDTDHEGVWVMRRRLALMATTEWVAQLDDDDLLDPDHLRQLALCAFSNRADMVYSWFRTDPPGGHPVDVNFGRVFDPANPQLTTSTVLIRTALLRQIRLGPPKPGEVNANDDRRLVDGAVALGARIVHLPRRTWVYRLHGAHTSGQPNRWS